MFSGIEALRTPGFSQRRRGNFKKFQNMSSRSSRADTTRAFQSIREKSESAVPALDLKGPYHMNSLRCAASKLCADKAKSASMRTIFHLQNVPDMF